LTHLPEVTNSNNQTQNNLRVPPESFSTSSNSSGGNTRHGGQASIGCPVQAEGPFSKGGRPLALFGHKFQSCMV